MKVSKEYMLNNVEKAPLGVQKADSMLGKILTDGPVLQSSYKKDPNYSSNLHMMLKISRNETHLGMIKQPKGTPDIVFVGTEFDLSNMSPSFRDRGEGVGWDLAITSPEGERTIIILNNKIFGDQLISASDHQTHKVKLGTRDELTCEQIPAVNASANLIVIFVGARLQEGGTPYGSFNAY